MTETQPEKSGEFLIRCLMLGGEKLLDTEEAVAEMLNRDNLSDNERTLLRNSREKIAEIKQDMLDEIARCFSKPIGMKKLHEWVAELDKHGSPETFDTVEAVRQRLIRVSNDMQLGHR